MLKLSEMVVDGVASVAKVLLCILILPLATELIGIHTYCVQSGSMEPVLKTGSIIFTDETKSIEAGDIVTFRKWDVLVTHRVLCEKNGSYITKGDSNVRRDEGTVSKNQIIGKVCKFPWGGYCIPYIGYLQAAATDWKWGIFGVLLFQIIIKRKKEVNVYAKSEVKK